MNETRDEVLIARASALIDAADSRGKTKRLAEEIDRHDGLREAVAMVARERGIELPDEAMSWPAHKLLRWARGRQQISRQRSNPIRRDESFTCIHCGCLVIPLGVSDRDHCPSCLRSLHVDVVPGDRENPCGGVLDPVGGEVAGGRVTLVYRCRRCGGAHRVKAATDGEQPDNWEWIVRTLAGDPPP